MENRDLKNRTKKFALRILNLVHPLWDEANQLVAIMTKSRKTAESSIERKKAS